MAPSHGNWKDLLKAAATNDLATARYQLKRGNVDPNFQHPEFFTAPLFEAIRHGHFEMVQLLVQEGGANVQLVEESSDLTPLQVALSKEQHNMVDYLNTHLPTDQRWQPRHVLVTGGNRGIGRAIVENLLKKGHAVAFTCRDQEEGDRVVQEILQTGTGNAKLRCIVGDLSSVSSTVALAQRILQEFPTLHVLIHNAGLWPSDCILNEDGLEMAFMVNYLAPYILTERLLPQLQDNATTATASRVILVTAGLFVFGRPDLGTTPYGNDFSRLSTYMNTKYCGMVWCMHQARLMTRMDRETDSNDASVTFHAVHPGVIQTGLGDGGGILGCVLRLVKRMWKTPKEGALAPAWLATCPHPIHGAYYHEMTPYDIVAQRGEHSNAAAVRNASVQEQWMQWTRDFLNRRDRASNYK